METHYQMKENGFDEIQKKMLMRSIPLGLLAIAAGTGMSISDTTVLLITLLVSLGAGTVGIMIALKRQKAIFYSYALLIDEENITRRQNLMPDITIPLGKITAITKHKNGVLMIKGENLNNSIVVPAQVEKIEELESKLSEIVTITPSDEKSLIQRFPSAVPIIMLGLMLIVYLSYNKILVGIAGTTLTIGLTYSLITAQRSKHVDQKTKRAIWMTLIVIFAIIAITYFKVFGGE